jgi:HAD superfamily hydrolase (TIGR01509 family)
VTSPRAVPRATLRAVPAPRPDELVADWLSAFAAAESAITSGTDYLGSGEASTRARQLRVERNRVAASLGELAHGHRGATLLVHCLGRPSIDIRLLGLPAGVRACIFDVEGALTTSAAIHRDAWCAALDPFLFAWSERLGREFVPFDPSHDYEEQFVGRPRLMGLHGFLASRGISLREGEPSDLPGTESVYGLANLKQKVLRLDIERKGVDAFSGSRAYLELAGIVGARRAVVSASANTPLVLQRAGIADLIDENVDGTVVEAESLRPKPAPDMVLGACARLGVDPGQAAAFETRPAGFAAARTAGVRAVVAVARDENSAAFSAGDVDLVVSDLGELLEGAAVR